MHCCRTSLDSARQFGMRALEARVTALLAQPRSLRRRPAANDDDLTSREIEVLRLLAIGRSNADIAMVLEISLNTVATHVRNILAKTGCANRTEAAAYAMRHGSRRGCEPGLSRVIISDERRAGPRGSARHRFRRFTARHCRFLGSRTGA